MLHFFSGPVQAMENVTQTRGLHWPSTIDRPWPQGPFWKKTESMLCQCVIATFTLAPAGCRSCLMETSSPLKPNVIDRKVLEL